MRLQGSAWPASAAATGDATREPITAPCVVRRMATKPLLPEVVAERAKATEDYRREQQAAIDRIATLRAARLKQEAKETRATARKG
jgi:hypothetical protein